MKTKALFITEAGVVVPAHVFDLLKSFGDVMVETIRELSLEAIMDVVTKHTRTECDDTITDCGRIGYKLVIHRAENCYTFDADDVADLFDLLSPNTVSMYITTDELPKVKPFVKGDVLSF